MSKNDQDCFNKIWKKRIKCYKTKKWIGIANNKICLNI